jgi:hypothetical protein
MVSTGHPRHLEPLTHPMLHPVAGSLDEDEDGFQKCETLLCPTLFSERSDADVSPERLLLRKSSVAAIIAIASYVTYYFVKSRLPNQAEVS